MKIRAYAVLLSLISFEAGRFKVFRKSTKSREVFFNSVLASKILKIVIEDYLTKKVI